MTFQLPTFSGMPARPLSYHGKKPPPLGSSSDKILLAAQEALRQARLIESETPLQESPYLEGLRGSFHSSFSSSFSPQAPDKRSSEITTMNTPSPAVISMVASVQRACRSSPLEILDRATFLVRDKNSLPLAVFKPRDMARGMVNSLESAAVVRSKISIQPALEAANEVIASEILNLPVSAVMLNLEAIYSPESPQESKEGVLLRFINAQSLTPEQSPLPFTLPSCQILMLTDLLFCNTDRSLGNVLYNPSTHHVFGIDHACILPEEFVDSAILCWRTWPQAMTPFSTEFKELIRGLNFERNCEKVLTTFPAYSIQSLETMKICYYLLQQASLRDLPPFAISSLLVAFSSQTSSVIRCHYVKAKITEAGSAEKTPQQVFENLCGLINQTLDVLMPFNWPQAQAELAAIANPADQKVYISRIQASILEKIGSVRELAPPGHLTLML